MSDMGEVFLDPSSKQVPAWRARLDGEILPPTWNSKGAALAGLYTERQRRRKPGAFTKKFGSFS